MPFVDRRGAAPFVPEIDGFRLECPGGHFLADGDDAGDRRLVRQAQPELAAIAIPVQAHEGVRRRVAHRIGRDARQHARVALGALARASQVRGGLPGKAEGTIVIAAHAGTDTQRQRRPLRIRPRHMLEAGVVGTVLDHPLRIDRRVRVEAQGREQGTLVQAVVDLGDELVCEERRDLAHGRWISTIAPGLSTATERLDDDRRWARGEVRRWSRPRGRPLLTPARRNRTHAGTERRACAREKRGKSLVPGAGLEPARGCPRGILSPLRLPISPPGQVPEIVT